MRACASIWATQLKPSNTTWSSHEERHCRRNPALFIHTASMPRVDSMWLFLGDLWPWLQLIFDRSMTFCMASRVLKRLFSCSSVEKQALGTDPFWEVGGLSPFLVIGSGLSLFLVMGNQVAECCHRVIQASTVIHTTPKAKHSGFESLKTYLVWRSPFQLYQTTATRF